MKWIIVLLVLLCLCHRHEVNAGSGCLEDWIRFRDTDRCYYISDKPSSFDAAKKHCESLESELIPPLSCDAMVGLSSLLVSQINTRPIPGENLEFWIGVNKLKGSNSWSTTNGEVVDEERQFWEADFPQGNGSCALLSFHSNKKMGAWRNGDCSKQLKFVCIRCPDRFDYSSEIDKCLYLNLKKEKWNDARHACAKIKAGGQMVMIKNEAKQKAVRRYLEHQLARNGSEVCIYTNRIAGGKVVWIGGQTKDPDDVNSPYVWKPLGASETPFNYTNWYPGMPDSVIDGANCANIATSKIFNYRWEDNICFVPLCSICEF